MKRALVNFHRPFIIICTLLLQFPAFLLQAVPASAATDATFSKPTIGVDDYNGFDPTYHKGVDIQDTGSRPSATSSLCLAESGSIDKNRNPLTFGDYNLDGRCDDWKAARVNAAASGRVTYAGVIDYGSDGKPHLVRIHHGTLADGRAVVTEYLHMGTKVRDGTNVKAGEPRQSYIAVNANQCVKGGDLIGYQGYSGWTQATHLHYAVKVGTQYEDPVPWFNRTVSLTPPAECPGTSDTSPPDGAYTSPANGTTISSRTVSLSAWASDNSSGVRWVRFNARWNNQWRTVHEDSSAPYEFTWDWCSSSVPDGDVELGLHVMDNAGNEFYASSKYPNPHITKNFPCPAPDWEATYYQGDRGSEILKRTEGGRYLLRDWDGGSPASGVPSDYFSAEWAKNVYFEGGDYTFYVNHDDGLRICIDGCGDTDDPYDNYNGGNRKSVTRYVAPGNRHVIIQYKELTGGARAEVWWEGPGDTHAHESREPSRWFAQYFPNKRFDGPPMAEVNESYDFIDHQWQANSPGWNVPDEYFSSRYEKTVYFTCGTYRFNIGYDDGARFYVDDVQKFGNPSDGAFTTSVDVSLSSGEHALKLDHYENQGWASVSLNWQKINDNGCTLGVPTLRSPLNQTLFDEDQPITLTWDPVAGATGYVYEIASPAMPVPVTFSTTETSANVGPQSAAPYSWRVRANNGAGAGEWSAPWSFSVRPKPPTNLSAQAASCSQINLSWSASASVVDGYRVKRDTNPPVDLPSSQLSYQDVGLTGGTLYTYIVKAVRNGVESASVPVSIATPTCSVGYNLTVSASPSGGGSVTADPAGPTYAAGTVVNVTAIANSCYTFVNWTVDGVLAGDDPTLTVTMDRHRTVVANFTAAARESRDPSRWFAQYYANDQLSGAPCVEVNESGEFINHEWYGDGPGWGMPVDLFSTRFQRRINAPCATTYSFTLFYDDGVRFYVDGVLKFEDWTAGRRYGGVDVPLTAGDHELKVEHYENNGWAAMQLSWFSTCSQPPANDNFAAGKGVTTLPFTDTLNTVDATIEPDEPLATCAPIGRTVWYTYTPAATTTLTIATAGSSFDTVLAVYTGSAVGGLTPVAGACNDDDTGSGNTQSRVAFTATAGTTYRVQVGGFNGSFGDLVVNFSTGSPSGISVAPASLDFGNQQVGTTSAPQTVTLTNNSGTTLSINSIATVDGWGAPAPNFAISSQTCGSSLAAGASCTITVVFAPTSSVPYGDERLVIIDNGAGSPRQVALSGTGTPRPGAALTFTPASLDFGAQPVGVASVSRTITVTSSGSAPTKILAIGIDGFMPQDYTQTNTCAGVTLNSGASCAISVTFTPAALNFRSARLWILSDAAGNPHHIGLAGTGVTQSYTLALSSTAGGSVSASPAGPSYPAGTGVTITATPAAGYTFAGWTVDGAPAGAANPLALAMNANHTVTATFAPIPPKTYTLTVSTTGNGTVTASPSPGPYPDGTVVTLTAIPGTAYSFSGATVKATVFTGWTVDGADGGRANPLALTMTADRTVVANFAPEPQPCGGAWSCWASQGGILTDSPAAASYNGRVYVFAKGSDDALYVKSSANGKTYSDWQSLGGVLTAAPAAASFNGRLYVFAKGSDDALYMKSSADGRNFNDWTRLGGQLTAPPAAASVNGALYVLVRWSDNTLYIRRSTDGRNFAEWRGLGGVLTAAPAATGFRGQLYVFAKGSDDALYLKRSANGATFTEWQNLGGKLTAAPAAASVNGVLYLFANGSDSALYEKHSTNGTAFTEWARLGGLLRAGSTPAAAGVGGRIFAFVRWYDDALYERHLPK